MFKIIGIVFVACFLLALHAFVGIMVINGLVYFLDECNPILKLVTFLLWPIGVLIIIFTCIRLLIEEIRDYYDERKKSDV